MEKIGHLCDYVLWDEAWIGYNAFHPLFAITARCGSRSSTRRWRAVLTQSVHKQGAGFSQPRRSTSATSTSAVSAATSSTSGSTNRS